MIQILIVDDDVDKASKIEAVLRSIPELDSNSIVFAKDLVGARDVLTRKYFDLLILDICLPPSPGDEPTASAGRQFVRELSISQSLLKPAHIIGITAYDDAKAQADDAFINEVWRIIIFSRTDDTWSRQLQSKVQYLIRSKREIVNSENAGYEYDLGIITALHRPELRSVLDLPVSWNTRKFSNDPTEYHVGVPNDLTKRLKVVATCGTQMGMAASTVIAMKVISHFRPRYLCIVGIAAGIKDAGVSIGDILIAEQSWDYESGKRRKKDGGTSELIPDPRFIPLRSDLKELLLACTGKDLYVGDIEREWHGDRPESRLKAVLGPLATGAAVVEDPLVLEQIIQHSRKLIGIEMETYGVFFAGENCSKPRPLVFGIKSVCDYADPEKGNVFQSYAAYTSAQYMWRFAMDHLAAI